MSYIYYVLPSCCFGGSTAAAPQSFVRVARSGPFSPGSPEQILCIHLLFSFLKMLLLLLLKGATAQAIHPGAGGTVPIKGTMATLLRLRSDP